MDVNINNLWNEKFSTAKPTMSLTSSVSLLVLVIVGLHTVESAVHFIQLYGSHLEMGTAYGSALKQSLTYSHKILIDYAASYGVTREQLVNDAEFFHQRYSYAFEAFLVGVAKGSGLSLSDVKILNAMETLNLSGSDVGQPWKAGCSFLFIPPSKSATQSAFAARNLDYPAPFDAVAKNLVVATLNERDKIPTSIISMPGQMFCNTCVNSAGLFMELNNGDPSGGFYLETKRKSLQINMLEFLQNSNDYDHLEKQMFAAESDCSFVINTAGQSATKSFEYSSTGGMRPFFPPPETNFASTNYFLNTTWPDMPIPTDMTTWMGVTRRNNLLSLAAATPKHTVATVQSLMNKQVIEGGACAPSTIYQTIYDFAMSTLYIRTGCKGEWTKVDLARQSSFSVT